MPANYNFTILVSRSFYDTITTQVIKLFEFIRKGNSFSSFGGKRSKTISF